MRGLQGFILKKTIFSITSITRITLNMNGLHASDGVILVFVSLCITLSPLNQTTFQLELAKVE